MDELENMLTREVAGRPVWHWLLIVAAGIALSVLVNRRFGPRAEVVPDPLSVDPTVPGDSGLTYGADPIGGLTLGADFASPQPSSVGDPAGSLDGDDPRTNADWLADAAEELAGRFPPAAIYTALQRFLNGQPLTTEQYRIVNEALRLGPPPNGAPPIQRVADGTSGGGGTGTAGTGAGGKQGTTTRTGSDPAPSGQLARLEDCAKRLGIRYGTTINPGDAVAIAIRVGVSVSNPPTVADVDRILAACKTARPPGGGTTHRVRAGDTYWSMAERYYGSGGKWRRIAEANPWPAREIPIGVQVVIP